MFFYSSCYLSFSSTFVGKFYDVLSYLTIFLLCCSISSTLLRCSWPFEQRYCVLLRSKAIPALASYPSSYIPRVE